MLLHELLLGIKENLGFTSQFEKWVQLLGEV